MRIDFLGIEAFLSIAESGSFHRAAAQLNLSQTALSHRVRKLEDDLGLKLFVRTTRKVSLTPAGLELLPRARSMVESLATSCEALRAQGQERQARITIGCLPTVATYYLPGILKEFADEWPEIVVHVRDNSANEIAALVQDGTAEFGITVLAAGSWDLEIRPLLKERYVLLCPLDHPLVKRDAVTWRELTGIPLVRISHQAANRAILDDAVGSRGEALNWRYEVQHIATAVGLVLEGAGLTIVPELEKVVASKLGLVGVPVRSPVVTRTLGAVTKRGVLVSTGGQALLELIVARFKSRN